MSFLTATNTELIYNMASPGADLASTAATIVSQTASGTVAPAYLPPVFSIWQPSSVPGKGFRVRAAGIYDATAVTLTLKAALDSTFGTLGQVLASTGALTVISSTAGSWVMDFDIVFTGVSGVNLSGYVNGGLSIGPANNAAAAASAVYNLGGTTSAGASAATFSGSNWSAVTAYYWELQATWGTAPTHFACQEFQVFGLN